MSVRLSKPADAHGAIGWDFDWTVVDGGLKRAFFEWLDLDYDVFNQGFKQYAAQQNGSSEDRRTQLEFLAAEIEEGNIPPVFTLAAMEKFGRTAVEIRPGVIEAIEWAQTRFARVGMNVPMGIFSGFWAPIIRNSLLVTSGLIRPEDVHAQEFSVDGVPAAFEPVWLNMVSAETKPAAFEVFLAVHGISGEHRRNTLVIDDGYSGRYWMEHAKQKVGSAVMGVLNNGLPTTDADRQRLVGYRREGWVDSIVDNDFRPGGQARAEFEAEVVGMILTHLSIERSRGVRSLDRPAPGDAMELSVRHVG